MQKQAYPPVFALEVDMEAAQVLGVYVPKPREHPQQHLSQAHTRPHCVAHHASINDLEAAAHIKPMNCSKQHRRAPCAHTHTHTTHGVPENAVGPLSRIISRARFPQHCITLVMWTVGKSCSRSPSRTDVGSEQGVSAEEDRLAKEQNANVWSSPLLLGTGA